MWCSVMFAGDDLQTSFTLITAQTQVDNMRRFERHAPFYLQIFKSHTKTEDKSLSAGVHLGQLKENMREFIALHSKRLIRPH